MRLKFKDGTVRELSFNARLGARLIYLAQRRDAPDYRVELDPTLSPTEKKEQGAQLQREYDALCLAERCKI